MSLVFVLLGVILFVLQLVRFSELWAYYPAGLTIAGIPVGRLDRQQAAQRILEIYSLPVELHYGEAVLQMNPSAAGFEMDTESMLAAAELERTRQPFWVAFWNFLWARTSGTENVPLKSTISEDRLRVYLANEIAARYDHPPSPAMPIIGTVNFTPGSAGTSLDIERSLLLVENALRSPTQRTVDLPLARTSPSRPAFQNLGILLRQTIDVSGYDGLTGLYLLDLQNGQEVNLLYQKGETIETPPDVAFTASSTIKIPIMISTMRRISTTPDKKILDNLMEMISKSGNPPADWLMINVINRDTGPLEVTKDMRSLGLENTFLAGYFALGSPLLKKFETPANTRTDITTDPDRYSQTTPSETGMLLADIYECAQNGGGTLVAAFPGEITQDKCESMIDYLIADHLPALITAGTPERTRIAHKHGWVTDPYGVIHNISDAAIVYTPGGNYVLTVFLYHPTQLVWESASRLVSDLSQAVYNFYNIPVQ